jgi:hypothetical protein
LRTIRDKFNNQTDVPGIVKDHIRKFELVRKDKHVFFKHTSKQLEVCLKKTWLPFLTNSNLRM